MFCRNELYDVLLRRSSAQLFRNCSVQIDEKRSWFFQTHKLVLWSSCWTHHLECLICEYRPLLWGTSSLRLETTVEVSCSEPVLPFHEFRLQCWTKGKWSEMSSRTSRRTSWSDYCPRILAFQTAIAWTILSSRGQWEDMSFLWSWWLRADLHQWDGSFSRLASVEHKSFSIIQVFRLESLKASLPFSGRVLMTLNFLPWFCFVFNFAIIICINVQDQNYLHVRINVYQEPLKLDATVSR